MSVYLTLTIHSGFVRDCYFICDLRFVSLYAFCVVMVAFQPHGLPLLCDIKHYCHYALPTVLSKLFNLMIHRGYVPETFCQSYTVPLLKGNCSIHSKSLSANDFRGILLVR